MSKDLLDLIKKRTVVQNKIKRLDLLINSHIATPFTLQNVKTNLLTLTKYNDEYEKIQDKIYDCVTDAADIEAQEQAGEWFETTFYELNSKLMTIEDSFQSPSTSSSNNQQQNNSSSSTADIKLPKMDLPTFSGNYLDWTTFRDLFNSIVNTNSKISKTQKMHYLYNSLRGEAVGILQSLEISETNYDEAWKLLTARYEDKRKIVYAHLDSLFNQPALQSESKVALRKLLDTTRKHVRALNSLGEDTDKWDAILVHLVSKRLDSETRDNWEMHSPGKDYPKYDDLTAYLEDRCRALEATSVSKPKPQFSHQSANQFKTKNFGPDKRTSAIHHGSTSSNCPVCKSDHLIYRCDKFLSLSSTDRIIHVKKNLLCFNCLRSGHSLRDCKSEHACKKCNGRHNTLIHSDKSQLKKSTHTTQPQASNSSTSTYHVSSDMDSIQVLLATAIVSVKDSMGIDRKCRVLIDSGAQANFISENCCKSLGLKRTGTNVTITGIGSTAAGKAHGQVNLVLNSLTSNDSIGIEALVISKVTGKQPKFKLTSAKWNHILDLKLADPYYYQPGKIDILLGAGHTSLALRSGLRHGPTYTPMAQETIFGWILYGFVREILTSIQANFANCESESILRKFWELEEVPTKKFLTSEEKQCEDHFTANHFRDSTGRYGVSLPTKPNISNLGSSRDMAVNRLLQVERRLAAQPERKQQYINFMREFIDLNHMTIDNFNSESPSYYLPHHYVLKESSATTKLRVVFDGSAKSSTGLSINQCTMVGPTVQPDLFTLMLKFRTHIVALKADIVKFYRQFLVSEQHQNYQKIVWRESSDQQIQDYRICRVTYGTASAPFLATRCLNQLAEDGKEQFPLASHVLGNDCYVDDVLSGASTTQEAIHLYTQLTSLAKSAGLELAQWSTSNSTVLNAIPVELRASEQIQSLDRDLSIKALGVHWQQAADTFLFKVPAFQRRINVTKRTILSDLAKVFDPMGFLSPITIRAKIIFQEMWKCDLEWDQPVPKSIEDEWESYTSQLSFISSLQVERCITTEITIKTQLHGFCDASEKAYGAVVYMRNEQSNGSIIVRVVTAKSKVAPIKQISLPRLELCGAVVLAKLLTSVQESIKYDGEVFAWTDSTIVIQWLSSFPSRWKTFVANRVAEIQDLVPRESWHHVDTQHNPADLVSRGVPASELINSSLWWNGPAWLNSPTPFPVACTSNQNIQQHVETESKKQVLLSQISEDLPFYEKYSNLTTLSRITAYCLRFFHNCLKRDDRRTGELSCIEIQNGLHFWIRHMQNETFSDELKSIKATGKVKQNSKLKSLNLRIDSFGLLRVFGRLENADIPENRKHPILLPGNHLFTQLIIRHHHLLNLHAGPQLLQTTLQQHYWILRARDSIRQVTRKCVTCRRHQAQTMNQLMGNLPKARVTPGRPFLRSGLDYAGPFVIRASLRGQKTFKAYICLFVCLATKAIHLEAVSNLTTEAFLAALRRFSSRRGVSSDLYSDCGTNFVGADRELKQLLNSANHNTNIAHQLANQGINWHFNPPGAPHQGGLWEAGVKSVKFHLRRILGSSSINFEDFHTLLCQIEACLNSRPLCAISSDPTSFEALTPGHFLIGAPLTSIPEPDLTTTKVNRLSRWQRTQQLLQHFWSRWSNEYLTTLQQRFKWTEQRDNLKINDLVIIKDETLPPMKWKLGRITSVHPGADNNIRVATVRTVKGEFKRPITKLCVVLNCDD